MGKQILLIPLRQRTPVHSAFKIHDFFPQNQVYVLHCPPYSPDLDLCDFYLFCKIKNNLKGHRFQNVEDIQKNLTAAFKGIKEEEFGTCFEQWKQRMKKCIQSRGNYFEGDKLSDAIA